MLEIKNLSVSYGKRDILHDISFNLTPHKMTAVIGKNGSGKSTLLSCINQCCPYTGEIMFSDRNISLIPPKERAKLISILPQILKSPEITVEELVSFGRNPYMDFGRRLNETDRRIIGEAMDATGISGMKRRFVNTLSGGERQKAYLAMNIAQNTRVMALDEPTTYMDAEYESDFFELMKNLREKKKKTILIVLHNLSQAVKYADYIVLLDGGSVKFYGTAEDCLNSGLIEETFRVTKHIFCENGEKFYVFT